MTDPNEAKVEIISQTGLSSLSAITVGTLRPICSDRMRFVGQCCPIFTISYISLIRKTWFCFAPGIIFKHYKLLHGVGKSDYYEYAVYLLLGEIYRLKEQWPYTSLVISFYPKSRSTSTRGQWCLAGQICLYLIIHICKLG